MIFEPVVSGYSYLWIGRALRKWRIGETLINWHGICRKLGFNAVVTHCGLFWEIEELVGLIGWQGSTRAFREHLLP
ncbi:MAG: hypothetical protein KatS3mg111_2676 [Pirellulaceae bacterium]|nr:MAG: hypothetical protein KatS3mg111_2676 [Pirellulaceae bacterium]